MLGTGALWFGKATFQDVVYCILINTWVTYRILYKITSIDVILSLYIEHFWY